MIVICKKDFIWKFDDFYNEITFEKYKIYNVEDIPEIFKHSSIDGKTEKIIIDRYRLFHKAFDIHIEIGHTLFEKHFRKFA